MRVVYVSGPLWAPTWLGRLANIVRAAREAWRLARAGHAVICPHTNTGIFTLLPFVDGEKMARWLDADLTLIQRLDPGDGFRQMRGWDRSPGSQAEQRAALRQPGVEVTFCDGRPAMSGPLPGQTMAGELIAQALSRAGVEPLPDAVRRAAREHLVELLRAMKGLDPVVARALWGLIVPTNELMMVSQRVDDEGWLAVTPTTEAGPDVARLHEVDGG